LRAWRSGCERCGGHPAADDPDVGQAHERLKVRPPQPVLEGGLSNRGRSGLEQNGQNVKECGEGGEVERVITPGLIAGYGPHEALLDLVAVSLPAGTSAGSGPPRSYAYAREPHSSGNESARRRRQ
jgi:hypothetical protein